MKRLILAVTAVAVVSACSDSRERNIPVVEQPDRQLEVARPDTTDKTSSEVASRTEQPVSPVEQQARRSAPAKSRTPSKQRKRAAAPSSAPADTATARGYAPTRTDTAVTPDSSASANDSSTLAAATPRGAVAAQPADTAKPITRDTAPARPDTSTPAPPRDTTTARTDSVPADTTSPSPDSSVATSSTSRAAPSASAAGFDAAARTLPVGTEIHAALDDSISSRTDTAGRSITAQITQSVTGAGGRVLIPAGSTVRLTVARLAAAHSKSSQGRLGLKVEGVEVRGQLQPVQANVQAVPRELRGRGITGSDAAKVGAGAAGGAVLGGVVGGSTKGAVIGGVVGAAGGAVVANQTATRDVVVKVKTPVTFVLTAPLVTP
jgi:trimeric autotransporter adhesin